jgi:hypothetical protein
MTGVWVCEGVLYFWGAGVNHWNPHRHCLSWKACHENLCLGSKRWLLVIPNGPPGEVVAAESLACVWFTVR